MKTTAQTFKRIFGTIVIIGGILVLTFVHAAYAGNNQPDTSYVSLTTSQPSVGRDIPEQANSKSISQMLEDPKYWVNYLKNTVSTDTEDNSSSYDAVEEMQNNPVYWVDCLKQIVTEE
ncbi:MAG: hypothetical protein WCO63_07515 [Bacteroidota bacterium]